MGGALLVVAERRATAAAKVAVVGWPGAVAAAALTVTAGG